MPGIAGIISKMDSKQRNADLDSMISSMLHEHFYQHGSYCNDGVGFSVGWVDHDPKLAKSNMTYSADNKSVILFSGELFQERILFEQNISINRSELLGQLLEAYRSEGSEVFAKLNGWFSGVIYDSTTDSLIIFNDRYGMNRIYYHEKKNEFIFSSEVKSILEIRPELKNLNIDSLDDYFRWGCVLNNETLYKGIRIIPGGAAWSQGKGGEIVKKYYFDINRLRRKDPISPDVFLEELTSTFKKILPKYFDSEHVGISLTGGLDTRMIIANMDFRPHKIPCYTYGGMKRNCFDVKVAREVAFACGQTHQVLSLEPEFLENFKEYAEKTIYITDGESSICGSHEIYLSRKARDVAIVRMTGNYGSEIFRSVNYIKSNPPKPGILHKDICDRIHGRTETFTGDGSYDQIENAAFRLIPWLLHGRLTAGRSQLTVRTPYMDNELVALMFRAPAGMRESRAPSLRVIEKGNPRMGTILTDRGVSISHRSVFTKFLRFYREFLFKSEYVMNDGMPDWMTKLLRPIYPLKLENIFLGRHKIEQYRHWFMNELSGFIDDVMLDRRTRQRSYFNKEYLDKLSLWNKRKIYNNVNEIEKVVSLELICRKFIDR